MGISAAKLKIASGSNDKIGQCPVESIKTLEIDVAAIHGNIGAGLRNNLVQDENVGNSGVSDIDKYRDRALDIDHGVKFDTTVTITRRCPREQRKTRSIVVASRA